MDLDPSLLSRITFEPNTGCWLWLGSLTKDGYGQGSFNGRVGTAYNLVFTELVGPVPEGRELDHKCRQRSCVNPEHLEVVTHEENMRRAHGLDVRSAITHCPKGHEYTEENTLRDKVFNKRSCRECGRVRALAYYYRRKEVRK